MGNKLKNKPYAWILALALSVTIVNGCESRTNDPENQASTTENHRFDPTNYSARVSLLPKGSCGKTTTDLIEEVASFVPPPQFDLYDEPENNNEPSGQDAYFGAAIDVCDAVVEEGRFVVRDSLKDIRSVFVLGTDLPEVHHYWLFVFDGESNVTENVFESKNLFSVRPGEYLQVPINISKTDNEPALLSVIAVDADLVCCASVTNIMVSSIITDSLSTVPVIPLALEGGIGDPNLRAGAASVKHVGELSLVSIFLDDTETTFNLAFIDFVKGQLVDVTCQDRDSGSLITIARSGADSTSIDCSFPVTTQYSNVLVVIASGHYSERGVESVRFARFFEEKDSP